ncbi:MAG: hypothetical protein O6934_00800 [SAR324 cluster bacterium]|nr:hypothetical protein [SAR324 cluster bacterium]
MLAAIELPGLVAQEAGKALQSGDIASKGDGMAHGLSGGWWLEGGPWGTATLYDRHPRTGHPRPWLAVDRNLHPYRLWRWRVGLAEAALRLPGEGWLQLTPGAARHPLWGRSDALALWRSGVSREVACCAALDYTSIAHIPPLDRPGHLPPGAGEVLLNALAGLLENQAATGVTYKGPYPTEQLFHSLRRSFQFTPPLEEALQTFVCGEMESALSGRSVENPLTWSPAPFAPLWSAPDVLAQLRDGAESVWLGQTPFRRAWGAIGRLEAGARVWRGEGEEGIRYWAGLVLLGAPYRRVLLLDAQGRLLKREATPAEESEGQGPPLSDLWRETLFAWAILHSTAALAPGIARLAKDLPVMWAALPYSLADEREGRLLLQKAVFAQLARLETPESEAAMMLISDVLAGALPLLRRMAQRRLEEFPPARLDALLEEGRATQQAAGKTLERVVPALVKSLLEGPALNSV